MFAFHSVCQQLRSLLVVFVAVVFIGVGITATVAHPIVLIHSSVIRTVTCVVACLLTRKAGDGAPITSSSGHSIVGKCHAFEVGHSRVLVALFAS